MANKIVLKDVHPNVDGEYDFDAGLLTYRDFRTIKQIAGVRRAEIEEALVADDTDVVLALAVVTLRRNGKTVDEEILLDNSLGTIQLVLGEVEEESPPPQTPPESSSGSEENKTGSTRSSGNVTPNNSETSENPRSPTGTPNSAASATFASLTSRT